MLEEEEIDEWFSKELEKLEEEYYEILLRKESLKQARERFEKEFKDLIKKYSALYNAHWKKKSLQEKWFKHADEFKEEYEVLLKKALKEYREAKEKVREGFEKALKKCEEEKTKLELKWLEFLERK